MYYVVWEIDNHLLSREMSTEEFYNLCECEDRGDITLLSYKYYRE